MDAAVAARLLQISIENIILDMQNKVLDAPSGASERGGTLASRVDQVVDRGLAARRATASEEVARLVAAALRLIDRSGTIDPKVSEILAEAGLSNQAFYRHFRGKHELLAAVLDEGIRGLADYLEQRMARADEPLAAIREWIRGMAAQPRDPEGAHASRPFALARGRLAESFGEEVALSASRLTRPLRDALEEAARSGALPMAQPERDAEMLYLLIMGWVEARLIEGRIPGEVEVDRLERFVLGGLDRAAGATGEPAP